MRRVTRATRIAILGVVVGAAGCFSLGRSSPTQEHFVLGAEARAPSATAPADSSALTIGVRRPSLASYLASPFMVVRRGPNEVDFDEFHRWGEPLENGINRVLADALVARGFREVVVAPWPARVRPDYVLQLDVVRFEGMALGEGDPTEGSALLSATWEITRARDGALLAGGTTDQQRQGWSVGDYPGLVRLLDAALDALAGDIAEALAEIRVEAGPPHVP